MFSYVSLVRMEIALEAEKQFAVTISDAEIDEWLTLGDLARSIVGHAGNSVTEAEAVNWVRTLIVEGYGDSEAVSLTADDEVFSDYERATAWFHAPPYPRHLEERWFATNKRVLPYYCAYNAPSDLKVPPSAWLSDTVVSLARQMSTSLDFSALPKLADALEEAGCDGKIGLYSVVLYHCRDSKATHNRGCWVIDLVLRQGRYRAGSGSTNDQMEGL